MLWRRVEDRWTNERRRGPDGTQRAGQAALGVTEKGWRRRLIEKGWHAVLSPDAVVGKTGVWLLGPIYTRRWATQPNARHV